MKLVELEMAKINQCCAEMEHKLDSAQKETVTLIKQTEELKGKRYEDRAVTASARQLSLLFSRKTMVRKAIADTFLSRFIPTDSEIQILTSPSLDLNEDFFAALKRIQGIHEDCKALLITDSQQAG
jgi:hypothetical protein